MRNTDADVLQMTGVLLTWSLARNIHSELTRYQGRRNDKTLL